MQTILLISLGAVVGANLRYWMAQQVTKLTPPGSFPFGTLVINVTGSFVLGFFLVWTTERVIADPRWRLLVAVGFCGGYTTFSSYAFESFYLMEQGQWWAALGNMIGSNALSMVGVALGAVLARSL